MGRRTTVRAAALVLLGGLATSCAAAGPGDAEIEEWLESRPTTVEDGVVGAMSTDLRRQGEPDEPVASMSVGQLAGVSGLRVECLGDEPLRVSVEVPGADEPATDVTVTCEDGPHEEPLAFPEAQSVRVEVFGEDVVGAVRVAVLGESQPRR
ncbi:hypothetical protein [Oceanitalea stevensii]|uniref:Lipoprotein n=1 Tax=Oceanitalea stevensii TaxID=2763072 RepID=A0ABR8Z1T5_9MICO|nr:hypothetical protein [Oceanitalea stevensii]MBD8061921.1 hypothetical protein [Oceanitalea stevensii]